MASLRSSGISRFDGLPAIQSSETVCLKNPHFRYCMFTGISSSKILLAIFIFGTEFLSAVDKSAVNVAQSLGLTLDSSVVTWLFVVYTLFTS